MLDRYLNSNSRDIDKDKLTLDKLARFLWQSADILRGSIDSADYKHYIFGLLFLKRLSDQFEEERKKIKEKRQQEGMSEEAINEELNDPDNYRFFVSPRARWSVIRKKSEAIGNTIDKAFEELEKENPEKLEGVLTPIQFEDPRKLPDTALAKLIIHFSKKEYNLADSNLSEPDILGRAYEYLIKQFADDAGKKGGEFYTPQGVVQTLISILDPQEGQRICDPACGSGGMLVECVNYLKANGKDYQNLSLYGEEKNVNTWAIAKMNVLFHNIFDSHIKHNDTMTDPLLEEGQLMLFDIVIANPMWNQKEWNRENFEKSGDRFGRVKYGLPSKSSGDWMWVQHMLATLNHEGRMGIVLDNGALFRGGAEGKIRKKIVEADLIEGIIALPTNLFYNTGAPGCLIIFSKKKSEKLRKKIFFLHAENEYEEGKKQNFLRDDHIERIVLTYRNESVIEKFSDIINLEEIKDNDFNLNVSRYIEVLPEEEEINISKCLDDIKRLKHKGNDLEKQFLQNMRELNFE